MRAIKSLGQNFLVSTTTINKIAEYTATHSNLPLVEVGPGKGALTLALSHLVPSLTCIEKDPLLAHELSTVIGEQHLSNVTIINSDILTSDARTSFPDQFNLIGSLPFNIAKRIIHSFLCTDKQFPKHLFVVVQEEVADKYISAAPHGSALGAIARIYSTAKKVFSITRTQFAPIPKVEGAFVHFERRTPPPEHIELANFIHLLFKNPRKQLRNSLSSLSIFDAVSTTIDPDITQLLTLRAEQLEDDDIRRLFVVYNTKRTP